jgi:TonB family protein
MHRPARALLYGATVSLGVHVLIALLLPTAADVARRRAAATGNLPLAIEIEATPAAAGASPAMSDAAPAIPGGADAKHNIDARDPGQGGDRRGAQAVIVLLPRDDRITLSDAPLNALGVGQAQRIWTASDRASSEDRRATPHPADDPFLASGQGDHRERRPVAATDAREGARVAPAACREGTPLAGAASTVESARAGAGAVLGATPTSRPAPGPRGRASASPGRGILGGRGRRASESARVAFGRPAVDQGPPATTAEERESRVRDDADAEMLAARTVQSVVDATSRRGLEAGEGRGGRDAEGAPGTGGGRREGGRARALGPGAGSWDVLDTSDPRYVRWFLDVRRRIENAMVFPRARQLAMDQGTSVYEITLRRDGTLARAPRLIRTSGLDDLDHAALAAIEQSAPFAPVPAALAPGLATVEIRMPLEFSNPMVR